MKVILIAYMKNLDFVSNISREILFNETVNNFVVEGKEIRDVVLNKDNKVTIFNDGTRVHLCTIEEAFENPYYTHIYIDESIKMIPNGDKTIDELVKYRLVTNDTELFDLSGSQINFFSLKNKKLNITQQKQ